MVEIHITAAASALNIYDSSTDSLLFSISLPFFSFFKANINWANNSIRKQTENNALMTLTKK